MGSLKEELQQMLMQMQKENEKNLQGNLPTGKYPMKDPSLIIEPTYKCPKCKDTGRYLGDDNIAYECECGALQKQILESKLRFASVPETYKDVTLKDFNTRFYKKDKTAAKVVIDNVKYWLDHMDAMTEAGKGLYFWSVTKGCGKTMMAAALANELIHKHKKYVKFATSLDILDEIKATYNKDSEENEKSLLDDLVKADYLIIDDFGTERASDWAGEKFYQIVNRRYIDKKVTFFTSNYDLKNLEYDDRISNRIRERSFTVHFPEESVRELKAMMDNNLVGTA